MPIPAISHKKKRRYLFGVFLFICFSAESLTIKYVMSRRIPSIITIQIGSRIIHC